MPLTVDQARRLEVVLARRERVLSESAEKILGPTIRPRDLTRRHPGTYYLTPREVEVLQRLAEGDTNQEIADRLVLSMETIKSHVKRILDSLGAKNRGHAIAIGIRAELIE